MSISKREKLETLNVHELRGVARELGVHAPTKINKSDLIQETLDLLENRAIPCEPSKRGKPVKNNVDIQELLTWLNNDTVPQLDRKSVV